MQNKIKAITGSVRFWIITLTGIIAILEGIVITGGFDILATLDIIKIWLVAIAGLGTLDSVASKIGLDVAKIQRKR